MVTILFACRIRTIRLRDSFCVTEYHKNGFYVLDLDYYSFIICLGSTLCKMFYWRDMRSFYSSSSFDFPPSWRNQISSDFSVLLIRYVSGSNLRYTPFCPAICHVILFTVLNSYLTSELLSHHCYNSQDENF